MSLVLLTFYRRDHTRDARELDPALYGVNAASTEKVSTEGLVSGGESLGATATVADIVTFLNKVYCSTIGVEFEFTVSGRDDGGSCFIDYCLCRRMASVAGLPSSLRARDSTS